MATTLSDHVRQKISPKEYYSSVFKDLHWPASGTEPRVMCCFHKDKDTPSLHFNPETGAFYCHGCKASGNSIVSFHSQKHDLAWGDAAEDLYAKFIRPLVPGKKLRKWKLSITQTPDVLKYLTGKRRLLKQSVIQKYEIGWTGTRITIPIKNEFDLTVNVKMYDPLSKKHGTYKMVNYRDPEDEDKQYGTPVMLFPLSIFELAKELGYIVVCEGEWDALFLIGLGIPAITTTGGSKSWAPQYNELFRGLKVIIAYDNDKDGMLYDRKVVLKNLQKVAKRIKRLKIPTLVRGHKVKDVTDWGMSSPLMRVKKGWIEEFKRAETLVANKDEYIEKHEVVDVPLDQASRATWFNRRVRVEALITGKDTAPYMLPQEYRVRCNKSCDDCPLERLGKEFKQAKVEPTDPKVLGMIDVSQQGMKRTLLSLAGFTPTPGCQAEVEITKTFNIEQLILIPTLDSKSRQYVMQSSYFIGHGLHPNRAYQFEGTTVPHPQDQHATQLFDAAKPVQDEIETFTLTDPLRESLKVFQPGKRKILAHLMSIAEWQSRNITKIRERPDLHVAVDLVFHSAKSFEFNGEFQNRGMLDVLIIGDTRCGKGYVTEGLTRYYGLGEIASGENCSFAGLVGGLQQIGKRWLVTWGLIPLNHGRFVGIDEASSLRTDEIGHMSRVRSEGVAEINKIGIHSSAQANTRLIWLSNPRSGRPIMTYNAGVEAIKELVGANEDISRFDFALTVATNEVPSEVINAPADYSTEDAGLYPRDLCRALILWAWSRRPEQVQFSAAATKAIISNAIDFGHTYSSAIPLVQAENIRIKLSKLAVAVAARVFSTDEKCEVLLVEREHVDAACEFLRLIYSKRSMGYDTFSQTSLASSTISSKGRSSIQDIFEGLGKDRVPTMEGLLEIHRVTADTLGDFVGDVSAAKTLIGDLVRARCLTRVESGNWYLKNPDFSAWLRANRNGQFRTSNTTRKGSRSKYNGQEG